MVAKPRRRTYTAEYKRGIRKEAVACATPNVRSHECTLNSYDMAQSLLVQPSDEPDRYGGET